MPAIARGIGITRGSTRGACTIAMLDLRPNASLPSSSITKLRLLLSSFGNGCAGSSPSGVSTGINSRKKYSFTHSFCAAFHLLRRRKRMPSAASCGNTCSLSTWYWRVTSSCAFAVTWRNTSRKGMPSGPAGASAAISSLRPATRISKNSSRLLSTMHRKRRRSSAGTLRSSARASTRRLNSSCPSSRLR